MMEDPHLAAHLAHWGINIMQLAKTEASVAELEIAANASHEWGRIAEAGAALAPAAGAGAVGLDNLGNTCYMAAVLQLVAAAPHARALAHCAAARRRAQRGARRLAGCAASALCAVGRHRAVSGRSLRRGGSAAFRGAPRARARARLGRAAPFARRC